MTRPMFDVVGIGESSIDLVYRLPSLPTLSASTSKLRIAHHQVLPGGQVATTLATCASLGLTSAWAGAIGDDEHGRRIRRELESRGVDTHAAIVRSAPNRYAVILVDDTSGERIVLWDRDPRLDLSAGELPADL